VAYSKDPNTELQTQLEICKLNQEQGTVGSQTNDVTGTGIRRAPTSPCEAGSVISKGGPVSLAFRHSVPLWVPTPPYQSQSQRREVVRPGLTSQLNPTDV
jgi:hypothetical protein